MKWTVRERITDPVEDKISIISSSTIDSLIDSFESTYKHSMNDFHLSSGGSENEEIYPPKMENFF